MSINQEVWRIIEDSVDIQRNLSRNIINTRALASYIIKNYKLKASLDSVISAIRRYDLKKFEQSEVLLKKVFKGNKVSTRTNLMCVSVKVFGEIPNVFLLKNFPWRFRLITGSNEIKIIIDENKLSELKRLMGKYIVRMVEGLSEISLTIHKKGLYTKGVAARVTNELANNDVNIVEMIVCPPEFIFYVDKKNLVKAHEVLMSLV